MNIKSTLTQNVRTLRKAKGLSQAAFAEGVDASHSHIRQVETGQSAYSIELLERIASFFDVPIYELFKDENDIKKEANVTDALQVIALNLGYNVELRELPSKTRQISHLPDDIADAILMADEADLRTIRNILGLPIPKVGKKAN